MITKVMEYEKTPSAGTWYTNSIGIGSDEGAGIGDDNEPDWQHLRNIRTELMSFGYTTVHEFYDASHGGADASGDPTAAMVATAVETGASLFLYCGHGSQTTCVTSNYSTNEISAATNYGKYPFVVSVACNNGTFVGGECLTEEFMRASNTGGPTGAINACGSSILMAWAEPMETEDEISKILSQVSPGNLKYTFGGLFYNGQMSMLEDYPTNTGKEVMETWVMFGDPSVMIRSKTPVSMNVTNPSCFSLSSTSMNITCDLDGADVALYQDGVILSTGTVSSGSANLNFSALSSTSPITLTVTGYNRLPYQAILTQCSVGIDPVIPADVVLNMFPNPAGSILNIQAALSNGSYTIIIRNELGQQVMTTKADASNGLNAALDVHQLTNGVYMIEVISANGDVNANNKFVKM